MLHFFDRLIVLQTWLLLGWLACVPGCRPAKEEATTIIDRLPTKVEKIRAVATVGMVADMVRGIGGERIEVEQMMGSGVDPHLYKPTRDDVRMVMQADVIFSAGLHLEGKLAETLARVAKTKPVYAIANGLPASSVIRMGDAQEGADPHFWMDVSLWATAARALSDWLSAFDPDHAADYRENLRKYLGPVEELHEYALATLRSIPETQRFFVTSHDAFRYFGRAYGLNVIGIQGFSTESEAGLRRINDLVALLVDRQIPAVFFESSVPQRSLEAIVEGVRARGGNVVVAGPLYADAMGEPGTSTGTYVGMMRHNIELIARCLRGESSDAEATSARAPMVDSLVWSDGQRP